MPRNAMILSPNRANSRDTAKRILVVTGIILGLIAFVFANSSKREAIGFFLAFFSSWVVLMGWVESEIAERADLTASPNAGRKHWLLSMVAMGVVLSLSLLFSAPLALPLFISLALLVVQIAFALATWSVDKRQSLLMIPLILTTVALENVIARALGAIG